KAYLDAFVKDYKTTKATYIEKLKKNVEQLLDLMSSVFIDKDPLLRAQASIPIYFLLFNRANQERVLGKITRRKLNSFFDLVKDNRKSAEEDITKAVFEFLEYDRLSLQGTNDATSIIKRSEILNNYVIGDKTVHKQ